jgi:hypothetical protein
LLVVVPLLLKILDLFSEPPHLLLALRVGPLLPRSQLLQLALHVLAAGA